MPYSDKEKKHQRQFQRRAEAIERRTFCCNLCSYPFGDRSQLARHAKACTRRSLNATSTPETDAATAVAPSPIVLAQAVGEGSVPPAGGDGQQQQLLASEPLPPLALKWQNDGMPLHSDDSLLELLLL